MSEFEKMVADRFEGWELVEYLQIPVDEVIAAFEDRIDDARTDLEEFLSIGR
jgi:hypothetical protein